MGILIINEREYDVGDIGELSEVQDKIDAFFVTLKLIGVKIEEDNCYINKYGMSAIYFIETKFENKFVDIKVVCDNETVNVQHIQAYLGDNLIIRWDNDDEISKLMELFDRCLKFI